MNPQFKGTSEVFDLLEYMAPKLIKALKDGAQVADLAVLMDPVLWDKAKLAVADIGLVKAEMEPMDLDKVEFLVHESVVLGKAVVAALKA